MPNIVPVVSSTVTPEQGTALDTSKQTALMVTSLLAPSDGTLAMSLAPADSFMLNIVPYIWTLVALELEDT